MISKSTKYREYIIAAVMGVALAFVPVQAATYRPPSATISPGSITSAHIADSTIVNADVAAAANIAYTKLKDGSATYTWPGANPSATSSLQSSPTGTLAWIPSNLPKAYFASSTGTANLNSIPVISGDTLYIWGTSWSACGNANVGFVINLKQSTMAASSTVDSAQSAGANIGGAGCAVAMMTLFTATTTETINVEVAGGTSNVSAFRMR